MFRDFQPAMATADPSKEELLELLRQAKLQVGLYRSTVRETETTVLSVTKERFCDGQGRARAIPRRWACLHVDMHRRTLLIL